MTLVNILRRIYDWKPLVICTFSKRCIRAKGVSAIVNVYLEIPKRNSRKRRKGKVIAYFLFFSMWYGSFCYEHHGIRISDIDLFIKQQLCDLWCFIYSTNLVFKILNWTNMDSLCKIWCENTGFHWPVFSRILASFKQWLFILLRTFSTIYGCISLHEKCPNTEFFLFCIFPYLDWMRENTEHKKLSIWTLFTQCKSFSYTCCMNFSVAFKKSLLLYCFFFLF